tara:strand:+ start:553 stop:744 length:192 start_codon:yes stop_codon:yes gene_type:complete
MQKFNKKKLLNFEYASNTPLLSSNSKGENEKQKFELIKQRITLKKIKDINGMQITYEIVKKKN